MNPSKWFAEEIQHEPALRGWFRAVRSMPGSPVALLRGEAHFAVANDPARLFRHNTHPFVIADTRLRDRRFAGSFPANDHAFFVRLLESMFGIVAARHETQPMLAPRGRTLSKMNPIRAFHDATVAPPLMWEIPP